MRPICQEKGTCLWRCQCWGCCSLPSAGVGVLGCSHLLPASSQFLPCSCFIHSFRFPLGWAVPWLPPVATCQVSIKFLPFLPWLGSRASGTACHGKQWGPGTSCIIWKKHLSVRQWVRHWDVCDSSATWGRGNICVNTTFLVTLPVTHPEWQPAPGFAPVSCSPCGLVLQGVLAGTCFGHSF